MSSHESPASPAGQDGPQPEGRGWPLLRWLLVVAGLALVAATMLGLGQKRYQSARRGEERVPAERSTEGVRLNLEQAARVRVQPAGAHRFTLRAKAGGRIEHVEDLSIPVFTPHQGQLRRLLVKPGERVEKGQALAEIDSADVLQAEAELLSAVPELAKARAAADHAQRAAARQKRLLDAEAASLMEYEEAQSGLAAALEDLRVAEASAGAANQHLGIFGKSEADIDAITQGRLLDRLAILRAPISGVVSARVNVAPGQLLRSDAEAPMLTVADTSSMWFSGDIAESDASWMRAGLAAVIRVPALPGGTFTTTISLVGDVIDPETRNLSIRCVLPNPDGLLKAGMFAQVEVSGAEGVDALCVPTGAVIKGGSAPVVWCAVGERTYARKTVETGKEQDGLLSVVRGLETGDQVVVEGGLFLDSQMER